MPSEEFESGTNFLGFSGTRILYGSSLPVYRVTPERSYLHSVWTTDGFLSIRSQIFRLREVWAISLVGFLSTITLRVCIYITSYNYFFCSILYSGWHTLVCRNCTENIAAEIPLRIFSPIIFLTVGATRQNCQRTRKRTTCTGKSWLAESKGIYLGPEECCLWPILAVNNKECIHGLIEFKP